MSLAAVLMLALAVVNALASNLWLSILSVTSMVVWGSELYQLRRLPRRVEALSCPAEPDEH
jgi:predicted membrane metal-binding protein